MSALDHVFVATAIIVGSAVVALLLQRFLQRSGFIATLGALVGAGFGLRAVGMVLSSGAAYQASTPWSVPGGAFTVGIDPLSAFFLAPLFVLGGLCALYGASYLGPRSLPAAELNLLLGATLLTLIARHALLFLVAWEAMTVLAYLLITVEHGAAEVRRAGWVYLIAAHVAVMALLACFVALGAAGDGSLDFASLRATWSAPHSGATVILVLALVGFGIKAGVAGLHVWLPEAHAAAPSHVSAFLSAVLIKVGVYGILRTTLLVAPGAWFGTTLMILGVAGALLGIVLALGQRDLKRVLAYSSVENMGIILLGLGLGFWARARADTALCALAFAAALLHIWNHAAMKGLLFLSAGSVVHGTGTKDIECLGGLLGPMRWTGRGMLLGAVAIAGLPPLNGFVSEWMLYRALMSVGVSGPGPANLAAMGGTAALALVGGLAALCFVRLVGVVLLGTARTHAAAHAHESPAAMTAPIAALALICIAGGLAAPALLGAQREVLLQLTAAEPTEVVAVTGQVAPVVAMNLVLLLAISIALTFMPRRARTHATETWGCGYAAPSPRMQYTGRGFSELLSTRVLPRWTRVRGQAHAPHDVFPAAASFASEPEDPLTRGVYEPLLLRAGNRFARLRFLQQGNLHIYILYIVVTVIGGLAWVSIRDRSVW